MSFQQGLSGLNAASKNLEVIGNNVANASTFGAKTSRAEFSDMYAAALNGSGVTNIGIGVNLAAVAQQFTQGNVTATGNPMDIAIKGGGFFQLTDGVNPGLLAQRPVQDRQGRLHRQQRQAAPDRLPGGRHGRDPGRHAGPLMLPTAGVAPNPTSRMLVEMNLTRARR